MTSIDFNVPWWKKYREQSRVRSKKYYDSHKDEINQKGKHYYDTHKELVNEKRKQRYETNKEDEKGRYYYYFKMIDQKMQMVYEINERINKLVH